VAARVVVIVLVGGDQLLLEYGSRVLAGHLWTGVVVLELFAL